MLLQGKTESYGGNDDPYPVVLPGEDEPLSSNKIGEYVTSDFFYYYQFYINTKHCGNPFNTGWLDWPEWVPQLISHFDSVIEYVKAFNEREAYKELGHGK